MSATMTGKRAGSSTPASIQPKQRQDLMVLWGGIIFSLLFTGLMWWLGPRLEAFPKLPDQGATWYYWKLPEPSTWARITAWGFYLAQNISIWVIIFLAQRHRTKYGVTPEPL